MLRITKSYIQKFLIFVKLKKNLGTSRPSSISILIVALSVSIFFLSSIKHKQKKFADFIIFFCAFLKFYKIKSFKHKFLEFCSFINFSWGHARSRIKFGPVKPFWRLLDKNKKQKTYGHPDNQGIFRDARIFFWKTAYLFVVLYCTESHNQKSK